MRTVFLTAVPLALAASANAVQAQEVATALKIDAPPVEGTLENSTAIDLYSVKLAAGKTVGIAAAATAAGNDEQLTVEVLSPQTCTEDLLNA